MAVFTFDDCVFDEEQVTLKRDGETLHVEPQVFNVLSVLIHNRERVVELQIFAQGSK